MNINKFVCSICKFSSISNSNLLKHYESKKHTKNIQQEIIQTKFFCKICDTYYQSNSGLWRHKQKNHNNHTENVEQGNEELKNSLKDLKNDNLELKKMMVDLKESQQTSVTTINNNNEITNNNNNTFNINVFLNEKCNEAINLDDFMKNIVYELGDFKKVLEDYVGGSMSIIKNNMKQIPLNKRPMHYLEGEDNNQQVFHIRQNDMWKMETEINWLKQIDADDDDELEKQTLYFALKKLDHDKLEYLRYKFSANHDYMKNHKRLNCEVTRVDLKKKLYKEIIDLITLDPRMDV